MDQIRQDQHLDSSDRKCPKHKRYTLNQIILQEQVEENLICFKCAHEMNLSYDQTFIVDEIFNSTNDSIIPNFPPLADKNLQSFLNNLEYYHDKLESQINSINDFFNNFKTDILSSIELVKNQTKQQISALIDQKQQIIDVYNEISSKNSLQKMFNNNQQDINSNVKLMIEDKFKTIEDNTDKIKEVTSKYKNLGDSFSFNSPQRIKELTLSMIKNINFFKESNEVDLLRIFDDQFNNQQQLITNIAKYTYIILDLIKNPTNFCSKSFLKQIEQTLIKHQYIFAYLQEEEIYDKEKQSIFLNINNEQLQNMLDFQTVIGQQINNQGSNISQIQNLNLENTLKQLSKQFIFNKQQLTSILKKYPIFEFCESFKENQINQINFLKSNYYNHKNLIITKTNYNIQIEIFEKNNYALSFSDFVLDPNKKYIFRVQILTGSQADSDIIIGLIKNDHINNNSLINELSYSEVGNSYGIQKVIKGGNLFEGRKANINKEMEMRIHLNQRILKMANYPSYENVAEIQDKTQIEPNQEYRFGLRLYYFEHKIAITFFAVVDEFNNDM